MSTTTTTTTAAGDGRPAIHPELEAELIRLVNSGRLGSFLRRRWRVRAIEDDLIATIVLDVLRHGYRWSPDRGVPAGAWIFQQARWTTYRVLRDRRFAVSLEASAPGREDWPTLRETVAARVRDPRDVLETIDHARLLEANLRPLVGEIAWGVLVHNRSLREAAAAAGVSHQWASRKALAGELVIRAHRNSHA